MLLNVISSLTALLALMPASLLAYVRSGFRQGAGPDLPFWASLAVAVAGPVTWALIQLDGTWRTGLSTTLWVSIATCMVLFTGICLTTRSGWRLMPLLLPYLLLVGLFATATVEAPDPTLSASAPTVWVDIHIIVSVTTYALLTLSAVAALAAFLQERALKEKRPSALTRMLPPMADSEQLQGRLLVASEIVLGMGLATGMSVLYFEQGILFRVDHKTVLSVATFVVIGGLLIAHAATGVRGRRAARFVLLAFLLLTLGYPGVKFVTDVLIP
ncbi:cytochrome C biogenesis protein [Skermanella stibiiresistens SB22]|uniref:Cytochrome C biogenesis protein n=1 Tax=Skermanella stibiiresistens SB22 TaxID=1385369 RepID=W9H7R4_9PROT|nr:cytochrome c biogenesis protein CcsA [Skermanella stibiiresistens]EWY42270.1 cytochrome C biogenesis protein [Skermanella stibiiresistens SB22]